MSDRDINGLAKLQRYVLKPALIAMLAADGIGYFVARSHMNEAPPVPQVFERTAQTVVVAAPTDLSISEFTSPRQNPVAAEPEYLGPGLEAAEPLPENVDVSEPEVIRPPDLPAARFVAARPSSRNQGGKSLAGGQTRLRSANAAFARAFPAHFNPAPPNQGGELTDIRAPAGFDDHGLKVGESADFLDAPLNVGAGPASLPSPEPQTLDPPAVPPENYGGIDQGPIAPASSNSDAQTPEDRGVSAFEEPDAESSQASPIEAGGLTIAGKSLGFDMARLVDANSNLPQRNEAMDRFHALGAAWATDGTVSRALPAKPNQNVAASTALHPADTGPAAHATGHSGAKSRETVGAIDVEVAASISDNHLEMFGNSQIVEQQTAIRLADLLATLEPMMDQSEFSRLIGSKSADALVTLETLRNFGIAVAYNASERTVTTPGGMKIEAVSLYT